MKDFSKSYSGDPDISSSIVDSKQYVQQSPVLQNSEFLNSLQALSNSTRTGRLDQLHTHTIYSDNKDQHWDNKVGIKFTMERRVKGLPSIFLNNIQHSGTHFFNSRFQYFSFAKMQLANFPYLDASKFSEFNEGGCFAHFFLQFNDYNAIRLLELLQNSKVIFHFRDPRSVIVSASHLMYKKSKPSDIQIESLRWGCTPLPSDFHLRSLESRLNFLIEHHYEHMYANYVNRWLEFIDSLDEKLRKNVLVTEFKELKESPKQLFSKFFAFVNMQDHVEKVPKAKDLNSNVWNPQAGNSHFRKGLLDEWKHVCSKEQINYMSKLISKECYERFGWER